MTPGHRCVWHAVNQRNIVTTTRGEIWSVERLTSHFPTQTHICTSPGRSFADASPFNSNALEALAQGIAVARFAQEGVTVDAQYSCIDPTTR